MPKAGEAALRPAGGAEPAVFDDGAARFGGGERHADEGEGEFLVRFVDEFSTPHYSSRYLSRAFLRWVRSGPAVSARNWRRLSEVTAGEDNGPARVSGGGSCREARREGECFAMEVFAKEAAG